MPRQLDHVHRAQSKDRGARKNYIESYATMSQTDESNHFWQAQNEARQLYAGDEPAKKDQRKPKSYLNMTIGSSSFKSSINPFQSQPDFERAKSRGRRGSEF